MRITVTLGVVAPGGEPPSEFRIFAFGNNETSKGTFVFDAQSAISVIKDYVEHGAELMIDYDHASLAGMSIDPALAGKAAGWFKLEIRDGELWAADVRWTHPAAEALKRKEWRYMSPAFEVDEAGRVTSILNVAITNLPATHRLEPLMSASKKETTIVTAGSDGALSPKLVGDALEAVAQKDAKSSLDLLKQILAALLGSSTPAPSDGGGDGGMPADGGPPMASAETAQAVAASITALMRMTGAKSFPEVVAACETFRASHLELETERQKLAKERATLEAAERRRGCVDLVVTGGLSPAAVWEDSDASQPKKYLLAMPIADFRDYVKDTLGARGSKKDPAPVPPSKTAAESHGLTDAELKFCNDKKIDPKKFAEKRLGIRARSNQGVQQ